MNDTTVRTTIREALLYCDTENLRSLMMRNSLYTYIHVMGARRDPERVHM